MPLNSFFFRLKTCYVNNYDGGQQFHCFHYISTGDFACRPPFTDIGDYSPLPFRDFKSRVPKDLTVMIRERFYFCVKKLNM